MASWGDEVTQDDFLPPRAVAGPDENGVKTITEYRRLDSGKKEKVVTKVKTVVVKRLESDEVRRRRKLPRFGDAKVGEENITIKSVDEIEVEKAGRSSDADTAALVSQLTAAMGKRGNNSGGAASAAFWERKRANFQPSGISMSGGGTGVYVPPTKRGAGSSMSDRDNSNTLRVTNLSPETKDMDVRELFSRFGHVTRVYLAKDKVTELSRGFAFVSFDTKADAENARKNLHRYPYDHLILHVEWAKPSVKKDPGATSGLSAGFTSGYGKALPQSQRQAPVRR